MQIPEWQSRDPADRGEMYVNWTFRARWGANQAGALINVSLSPGSNLLTTTIGFICLFHQEAPSWLHHHLPSILLQE